MSYDTFWWHTKMSWNYAHPVNPAAESEFVVFVPLIRHLLRSWFEWGKMSVAPSYRAYK
jgi:hypothetical protein